MTDTPVAQAAPLQADVAKRVADFIEVRDLLKEMDDKHDAARKYLSDTLVMLQGWFQSVLDQTNSSSIKTDSGTIHNTTKVTASVADVAVFMDFIKAHDAWELLDKKANAPAVRDWIEAHPGNIVPGVNLTQHTTVGVRRPK